MFDLSEYFGANLPRERARLILDLLATTSPSPELRVEKMLEWRYNHSMEAVKLVIAAALSLLAAVLVAYLKRDEVADQVLGAVSAVVTILLTAVSFLMFFSLRGLHREYLGALHLLGAAQARRDVLEIFRTTIR